MKYKDFEDALKICTDKGFNPYEIVKGVQPICFENAAWAVMNKVTQL